ncbi:antitoxin [Cellulomonas sp. Root485]|jgi:hypothetical protein|nr:antitoxin [Cellulomonas sp. Root485]
MLICMRTTLLLPDDLYRAVKTTAAESGETMTSFVEDALREALRRRATVPAERAPFVLRPVGEGGLLPGVDLQDSSALLDVMEGR